MRKIKVNNKFNVNKIANDLTKGRNSYLNSFFKKMFFRKLSLINEGYVEIDIDHKIKSFGDKTSNQNACIKVLSEDFFTLIGSGGLNGAAEAYSLGLWECDEIVVLIRILAKNRKLMSSFDSGFARFLNPINKFIHYTRRNSIVGSKRNISAHYDLSNDFYKLWLDPTMTYSCAIFNNENTSLEDASIEKLDRICRKIHLNENDHLLEIGTGWGSFSLHAAKKYGCKITTTTISDSQYDYTLNKIKEENLSDKITLIKKDYRHLEGNYDKIVSIEMIEAVGHDNISTYMSKVSNLLKDNGIFALQGITYNDQNFDIYKNSVDFINKYIFPGACLISISQIMNSLKNHTDLILQDLDDITLHYAKTLNRWRKNFHSSKNDIKELGFSDNFIRLWDFYLVYCEAGFLEKNIGDYQFIFNKKEGLKI